MILYKHTKVLKIEVHNVINVIKMALNHAKYVLSVLLLAIERTVNCCLQ